MERRRALLPASGAPPGRTLPVPERATADEAYVGTAGVSGSGGGYREYVALVGPRQRLVRIEPDRDGLRVRVDGEEFHVGCESHAEGQLFLLLNGRPQVVNVRNEGEGRYRVMPGGIERSVRILDPVHSRTGRSSPAIHQARDVEIRSPMHGIVVAVQVEEGSLVDEETPLVVLEAMKMQNALTSPVRGRVLKLLVRVGQSVEGDALLVVLERSTVLPTTDPSEDDRR